MERGIDRGLEPGQARRGASRRRRVAVLALWGVLLAAFWLLARARGDGPAALMQGWLEGVATSPYGALVLLGLYGLRPLLLLPMTILTVFAGFLFGPALGLAYALGAMLASASLAYALARSIGGRGPEGGWAAELRRRSFEAVLTSRLTFVPGDVVNYAAGALRVRFRAFLAGTALGGLPGLAMGVLAGASIEGAFRFDGLRFRPGYLLASLALLIVSLAVSRGLRRRQERRGAP